MNEWIVVAADGSEPAAAAVAWAADEALLWERGLRIVHVTAPESPDWSFPDVQGLADAVRRDTDEILESAATAARERAPGVEVATRVLTGGTASALIEESEQAAELVVGSRGRGGLAGMLLGSVSLSVAGHASGPVVVVREPPGLPKGEIVVGFDTSPHADISMGYAMEQGRRRRARVRAVHAWMPPISPGLMVDYPDLTQAAVDAETRAVARALDEWRAKYPDVDIVDATATGHPVPAIAEAAEDADLVVVGSRGHAELTRAVLGSVGHGVLHNVSCPVAVVR